MSSKTRTLAIVLSAVMILSVLGTGAAVAAENETVDDEDGDELDDASTNETEDDSDLNDTDDNETDDDSELNETDDNETDDENGTDHQPFGQLVTEHVHGLIDGSNDTNDTNTSDVPLGQQIASFVVEHNPGNAPDHAGPGGQPDHAGGANETGQPDHAGPGNETGQPDDAGPDGEDNAGEDQDKGGGPPDHAGKSD